MHQERTTNAVVDEFNDLENMSQSELYDTENIKTHIVSRPFRNRHVGKSNRANYDVIQPDVDVEDSLSGIPGTPLVLTAESLQFYNQHPLNRDRRIVKWLVDVEGKTQNQVPAHLPNISTRNLNRQSALTYEDCD